MAADKTTAELLAEHADVMNAHGPYSLKDAMFVIRHRDNKEFVELAKVARRLKKAMVEEERRKRRMANVHPEDDEVFTCWCGAKGTYDELFDDACLDEGCGGLGVINCYCGGDFCVCHHHGEIECEGCEDCEPDHEDEWDDCEFGDEGDFCNE